MKKFGLLVSWLILNFMITALVPCVEEVSNSQADWHLTFVARFSDLNPNIGFLKGTFSLLLMKYPLNQDFTDVRGIIRTSGSQFEDMGFDFLQESLEDNYTVFVRHIETPVEDRFTIVQHPELFPWDKFELGFLLSFNETVTFDQDDIYVLVDLDHSIENYWQLTWSFTNPTEISNGQLR